MKEIKYTKWLIPDIPDNRDYKFEDKILCASQSNNVIFQEIDLCDKYMPDIYESQGMTGACSSFAVTRSLEYQINKAFFKKYNTNGFKFNNALSKRFLYYTARYTDKYNIDGTIVDKGVGIRNVLKALMKTGSCTQKFHSDKSDINLKPSYDAVISANDYRINAFYKIETLEGVINSLRLGLPVVIGANIDAMDDARATGFSKKSETWNTKFTSNHALLIVGLTKINNIWYFKIANSYGNTYGKNGYLYINTQKMWNCNIDVAWVFVLDRLVSDLENENPNYLRSGELSCNTLLISNYGFDLDYANDIKNINEIQEKISLANNNIFIKTASGELINNNNGEIVSIDKIIESIGNRLVYKDKNGEIIELYLR